MMSAAASQIADALRVAKSTVIRRAEAEGWQFTEEPGRGGTRRLYLVETLPANVRAALAWQRPQQAPPEVAAAAQAGAAAAARVALRSTLDDRAAQTKRQAALRQAGELAAGAQARMDARLALVRAFELYHGVCGLPLAQARIAFALAYNAGSVQVPAVVREQLPTTSDRSLERWQGDIRSRGITALAGAYGNRSGTSKLDATPALREFVQAMLVQYPHCRAPQVMRGLHARFGAAGPTPADLPSMRSLERWIDQWRTANREVLQALANPDAWKNKHMVAFGSKSDGITAINQLWERDSSPADVMCSDGRYALIAGIDVFSRRAKILVSRTSRAVAVGAHLRAMLLAYGVPATDKTDNGSDYTALYTERVYAALDIQHALCPPFQPWHKPHIERFFGTFTRDLVELLPGYIGHSVAERSAIEARKSFAERLMTRGAVVELRMSGADLQTFCDQWVDTIYHQQPHEALGQRTPFQVGAAHAGDITRLGDERALDILLAEAPGQDGRRTVQKKGIKLDEGWFIAPELEAWVGRVVQVRYDPIHHDLGTVFVFSGDDLSFVCIAQNPDRTGVDRRDVAVKAKALQRTRVQDERRALKAAAKRVGVDGIVAEILREKAEAAGKLTTLPRAAGTHTSAGLRAAGAATDAATAPRRTTADIEQLQAVQAAQARIVAEQVPKGAANEMAAKRVQAGPLPTPVFETVAERVHWLLHQAAFRPLGTEEQDAIALFKQVQPASFRRMRELVAQQIGAAKENAPDRVASGSGAV